MTRWMSGLRLVSALFVLSLLYCVYLFAFPRMLFATAYNGSGLAIYTTSAIDPGPVAASAFLASVAETLNESPLGPPKRTLSIYVTGDTWREKLFFMPARDAGGVVYVPVTSGHAFLSGADLPENRLLKGTHAVPPPRTLHYYAVHELTHLRIAEISGVKNYYKIPVWVNEGLADYVALGPMSREDFLAVLATGTPTLELMQHYGTYPVRRLLVSYMIHTLGWTPEDLISTDINQAAAMDMVVQAQQNGELTWH